MLPLTCFSFDRLLHRKKKDEDREMVVDVVNGSDLHCLSIACSKKPSRTKPTEFPLRVDKRDRSSEEIKARKQEMSHKVSHISGLIHRVASSCLTQHLPTFQDNPISDSESDQSDHHPQLRRPIKTQIETDLSTDEIEEYSSESDTINNTKQSLILERVKEMEILMCEVFGAVTAVRKAYVSLQEAHSPWDPERMRVADVAVVGELRRLGRLRDRFRRLGVGGGGGGAGMLPVKEVVAPYEAALEDLKRELRAKEVEVEGLKEKLKGRKEGMGMMMTTTPRGSRIGRKGKRVGCITGLGTPASPTPELFVACMEEVKSATKSFTSHLLSLMRSAHWDIAAAACSIINNTTTTTTTDSSTANVDHFTIPITVDPRHAKHALESYITRNLFHGFENETFYIDGSLASLLHPADFRRDCLAQFRDMRSMDPTEILGILPTCQFGKFAGKKYLSVMHPKMEESLFGGVEQRRQVMGGAHPRTGFYGEFLRAAKAVWMLHLVAFALEPPPNHFEAGKGAEFHPEYMESVVKLSGGGGGGGGNGGWVVGFPVGPGFKLGNGALVRARVYLVPRVRDM